MFKKIWEALTRRCETCSRIRLGIGVALVAILVCGGLLTAGAAGLAWTETEAFCIGCHEMRDNVYAEYKDTIHAVNRSGVRAICSDCHVPREPLALIQRKMRATFELWGHLRGAIDTKEKFEARRAELAKRVWTRMKQTDSRECRNCHHMESMNLSLQSKNAQARHARAQQDGKTCIDCHFGIAHQEPEGPGPKDLKLGG